MSKKSPRIAEIIKSCQGQKYDAHYVGYFKCFNGGLFYESHEVLEELWLPERKGPNDAFYKGLIQLAGAFVHLRKNRLHPAAALFKLAWSNLQPYPPIHHGLEIGVATRLIEDWLEKLTRGDFKINPLESSQPPELRLHAGP